MSRNQTIVVTVGSLVVAAVGVWMYRRRKVVTAEPVVEVPVESHEEEFNRELTEFCGTLPVDGQNKLNISFMNLIDMLLVYEGQEGTHQITKEFLKVIKAKKLGKKREALALYETFCENIMNSRTYNFTGTCLDELMTRTGDVQRRQIGEVMREVFADLVDIVNDNVRSNNEMAEIWKERFSERSEEEIVSINEQYRAAAVN